MKSNKLKNTIFFKGQKLYNELMFNNILRKNNINNTFILKKTLKYSFISKYYFLYFLIFLFLIFIFILHLVSFIVLFLLYTYL